MEVDPTCSHLKPARSSGGIALKRSEPHFSTMLLYKSTSFMNNSFLLLAKLEREMQVIQENSLDLLVGQLHVELLIVDPLGAYNWLGVLVGLQLLRVVVELQQLVGGLQLGIPGHLAWKKVFCGQ